jgi:putative Mg2+ transporter-C (MgtC) family protein
VSSVLGIWNDSFDHLVHLLIAFILALPIGWTGRGCSAALGCAPSRELRPRTNRDLRPREPTHANILRGIVIGVGFIAAGAIIRQRDITTGNATAASVWAACGCQPIHLCRRMFSGIAPNI